MRPYKTSFLPILLSLFLSLNIGCGAGGAGTGIVTGVENQHPENISNTSMDSYKPVISADNKGNVYVAWEEGGLNTKKETYLGASANSGGSFSIKKDITKYIDMGYDTSSPHIGLKRNGAISVVWAGKKGSQRDIFYSFTKDYGDTFFPPVSPENISNSSSDSSEPLMGFEGTLSGLEGTLEGSQGIDAAWVEGPAGERKVAFSRASDPESSFSTPQTIFSAASDSHCPAIASSGAGKIYLAYKGDNRIYFARWEANTSSFSDIGYISPDSASTSCPEIGLSSNGTVYIVWSDNGGIWVAMSSDTGYSFTTPKDISDGTGTSSSPKIAMDGSYVNLIWVEEATGSGDIFFSGSVDNGQNFSSPKNLSNTSTSSLSPVITWDGSKYIYVAWAEGDAGSRDIFLIKDKGARGLLKP